MNYEIRGETPKEKITYAGDPEEMQKMIDEENEKDAVASDTKRIVMLRDALNRKGYLHDNMFTDFTEKNGVTDDEVISEMVEPGWVQGRDIKGNFEYWEAT